MARICWHTYIRRLLIVQLIILVVIKANYSAFHNNVTFNNDSMRSGRFKRAPNDIFRVKLEAMIIDENGKFIHLQWTKAQQTLANKHLPIWTAHLNSWGAHHKMQPDLSHALEAFTAYHDLEQNSAVMYVAHMDALSGSIGTKYYINGLPINLLHQCHTVGGPYLSISAHQSHRTTEHPEPTNEVLRRFENCAQLPSFSDNLHLPPKVSRPSQSSQCKSKSTKVHKRESNSNYHNATKIRKRREEPEHFYIEIILFIPHDIVEHHKTVLTNSYLFGIVTFHLIYFNAIDMLYAKLQTNDLHIHINLAGIIIEEDKGAFDAVIDYTKYATSSYIGELLHSRFIRYLDYFDLPFQKDTIDMIYVTTSNPFMPELYTNPVAGLTWHQIDMYRTRQMYKHTINVPLTMAIFTNVLHEFCIGAHEIGHAIDTPHDPQNVEIMKGQQCYGLMQEFGPHCFNCMEWSPESINHFHEFTRLHKNRCFLLNYPRSLNPPGPRATLSPCRQCHCYGYKYYGKHRECLLQVPATDCGKRLQCRSPYHTQAPRHIPILPLDGTPCGNKKVCWEGNCVGI